MTGPAQKSIFSRLVLWSIVMATALVLALWVMADQTIKSMNEERLIRAVDVDLAGLVDIYASGGLEELSARIGDRRALTSRVATEPYYLLATNNGRRIAGADAPWPELNARLSETGVIAIADGGTAYARATRLGPDLRLLVGREFGDDTALRQRVALVFFAGGALLVMGVGLLGRFTTRRLAGRIETINMAFRDVDTPLPIDLKPAPERDEIDELTSHSAAALSRMQRLVEAHRETSDHVAHELRTPLMHLDNQLVKALRTNPDPDCAKRLMEARDDIKRIIAMLEALLDIATSKARQGDAHGLKRVDLSALLAKITDLYADSAEESGHDFSWDIAKGIAIQGENMQLTRLITNLLDNAFKYVPAGGKVELLLQPGPVLTVRDDGPGIPEEMRAAIFERFNRGGRLDDGLVGSGLGLALARAIAERHGMQLGLSDRKQGAEFVLSPAIGGNAL